jgi:hypothetical protein
VRAYVATRIRDRYKTLISTTQTPSGPRAEHGAELNREGNAALAQAEPLPRTRKFVWAALLSFFGLLGTVLLLNLVVDPFALSGTQVLPPAIENDREVKLSLIDDLEEPPGILILGSSRARLAEPAYLQLLTGRSGFNAGVTGGTAADAWVMTNHLERTSPLRGRGYIWFIDPAVATNGVNPLLSADTRAQPYLSGGNIFGLDTFGLDDLGTYLGTEATDASVRVLKGCARTLLHCRSRTEFLYLPDGAVRASRLRSLPENEGTLPRLERSLEQSVERIRSAPPQPRRLDPQRFVYFEKTLAFMNEHGSTPVIVLNPVHPSILAELRKHGHPHREAALEYIRGLHARYDFVFVDAEDISAWGGSPADFANASHVNRRNMRRMLDYIVANSEGALD